MCRPVRRAQAAGQKTSSSASMPPKRLVLPGIPHGSAVRGGRWTPYESALRAGAGSGAKADGVAPEFSRLPVAAGLPPVVLPAIEAARTTYPALSRRLSVLIGLRFPSANRSEQMGLETSASGHERSRPLVLRCRLCCKERPGRTSRPRNHARGTVIGEIEIPKTVASRSRPVPGTAAGQPRQASKESRHVERRIARSDRAIAPPCRPTPRSARRAPMPGGKPANACTKCARSRWFR
jgi:hypothetical protein